MASVHPEETRMTSEEPRQHYGLTLAALAVAALAYALMQTLKRTLDPQGILNPGKVL